MPTEIKRDDFARFYEEVGAKYPEEDIVYRGLRGRLRKEFVLSFLEGIRGSILDIGCNTGMYLKYVRSETAVGVDLSTSALSRARDRCSISDERTRYHFIAGDIRRLDFLRGTGFDFILCSEVLEHVTEPAAVFEGIERLLKPGGRALITTPNYREEKPTWVRMSLLKSYGVEGEYYYHTAYRPEELQKMCAEAGLNCMECGTLEWEVKYAAKVPALVFMAVRWFNRKTMKSAKFDERNQRIYDSFTLFCYQLGQLSRLEGLIRPFIKEGVRSYILMGK